MLNLENSKTDTKSNGIELVEQEQQEYKLVGSFMRTKGLKLFGYNHSSGKLYEVEVTKDDEIHLTPSVNGLTTKYSINAEAKINSADTHFEALNLNTAIKRVNKFTQGKIKDLCNLKPYNPKPIL